LWTNAREPFRAIRDDLRNVRVRLDVVVVRRLAPQTGDRRERRARAGLAPFALDRGDEGRLFATHKGPGAFLDVHAEGKVGPENAFAEQAQFGSLGDGQVKSPDGQGILGTAIDVALVRADGIGGDGHALEDRVRVALQDGAVHEGTRVALIAIANQESFFFFLHIYSNPFRTGRKTSASTAPQAALCNLVDYCGWLESGGFFVTFEATKPLVFFKSKRIDFTTVLGGNGDLLAQELRNRFVAHIEFIALYAFPVVVGLHRIDPLSYFLLHFSPETSWLEMGIDDGLYILGLYL